MVSNDAGARVLPIGHCIGAYYDGSPFNNSFFQVRIGPDVVRLSHPEFAVWGLAHGTSDRRPEEPWNRDRIIEAGRTAGLLDAERVLGELLDTNVLVETTTDTEAMVDFASRYRMLPLMLGLGNTSEQPRVFAAGMIGQPIVLMSSMIYDLFAWAHLDPNLWSSCLRAAETAAEARVSDATATDPVRLLDALLRSLHTLLSPNAVCLDTI